MLPPSSGTKKKEEDDRHARIPLCKNIQQKDSVVFKNISDEKIKHYSVSSQTSQTMDTGSVFPDVKLW